MIAVVSPYNFLLVNSMNFKSVSGQVESRHGIGKDSEASAAAHRACNASTTSSGSNDPRGPGQGKRGCLGEGLGLLKGLLNCLRRGRKRNDVGRERGPCSSSKSNAAATPSTLPLAPQKIREIVQTILQGKQSKGLEPDAEFIG